MLTYNALDFTKSALSQYLKIQNTLMKLYLLTMHQAMELLNT